MPDHQFENQVRQHLDDLHFNPSGKVWENVDKAIHGDQPRKRPFLWIWVFVGLVTFSCWWIFLSKGHLRNLLDKGDPKTQTSFNRHHPAGSASTPLTVPSIGSTGNKEALSPPSRQGGAGLTSKVGTSSQPGSPVSSAEPVLHGRTGPAGTRMTGITDVPNIRDKKSSGNPWLTGGANEAGRRSRLVDLNKSSHGRQAFPLRAAGGPGRGTGNPKGVTQPVALDRHAQPPVFSSQSDGPDRYAGYPASLIAVQTKIPDLNPVVPEGTQARASLVSFARPKNLSHQPGRWKPVLMTGGGITGLQVRSRGVLGAALPAPATGVSNPGAALYGSASVRPNIHWEAGLLFEKHLSKGGLLFSGGFAYHYYSNRISTGSHVDSMINIYYQNTLYNQASGFYRSGSSYIQINRYHFLEIPLMIRAPLNSHQRHPLYWETGLTPGYLFESHSLYFDPNSGIYYKNDRLYSKFQMKAAAGLLLGFPWLKGQLQMGPQLEYSLTNLLNKTASSREHLFAAGIRILFIPAEK